MAKNNKLTPKQAAFVENYLLDLNATQAAIRAGYSKRTANEQAARLLANVSVAAAIAEAMRLRAERNDVSADRVLRELARIAFFDVGKAFTPEGTLKPLSEMDEDTRRAIAGLEVSALYEDGEQIGALSKIKLGDKIRALDLIGRHLGMLDSKITVRGDAENPLTLLIKAVQGSSFNPVVIAGDKAA
ncbi:terminase small subunit [Methylocystis sp.]|uniref:terminase small subunit n=1 Tax=Methylocystis sp. TaxID=1911079 RepID=UPI0027332626|nr:terminase small subunit [Methylocystis sp.]MDP3552641.1 terminase small subunit [Methylocystis sp.]